MNTAVTRFCNLIVALFLLFGFIQQPASLQAQRTPPPTAVTVMLVDAHDYGNAPGVVLLARRDDPHNLILLTRCSATPELLQEALGFVPMAGASTFAKRQGQMVFRLTGKRVSRTSLLASASGSDRYRALMALVSQIETASKVTIVGVGNYPAVNLTVSPRSVSITSAGR
jgi:hypothetical protein